MPLLSCREISMSYHGVPCPFLSAVPILWDLEVSYTHVENYWFLSVLGYYLVTNLVNFIRMNE